MSEEKLKPCPFCGGEWLQNHPTSRDKCAMTSIPVLEELNNNRWTKEQAIYAWNTRRNESSLLKVVEEMENSLKRSRPWVALKAKQMGNAIMHGMVREIDAALSSLNKWRESNKLAS